MAMKLSMPVRHIKSIVLTQRKAFQLSLNDFGGHILSYRNGQFKLFPYALGILKETTLQYDMAWKNYFHFR